ncbi:MAG: aldehyde dehydrogenase [Saprospiraceae bacterium]|nr:aldehyde dehydrogenase [Saprospiraceae bacterium]
MIHVHNFIDGKYQPALSGATIPNVNPSTGQVYGTIADSDENDVNLAVHIAQKAFPAWSQTSLDQRFAILNRIADIIDNKMDELALAESTDNGKPLWLSKKVDIPRAASNFRFFATAIKHFSSESYYDHPATLSYTLRQPIGIVGCISPWNLPLYLFTWKIVPAIAAGNCIIAKPSEITPVTASILGEICNEAGLPAGVLNILHGTGPNTGNAIVSHPDIKAISFTGGTATGKHIISIAGPMLKKLSLELGGKNAAIILDDCNYEKMLKDTVRSAFSNQGQICLCTSRLLIQDTIYDRFKSDFTHLVSQLKVGQPLETNYKIDQGAIVSKQHFDKILSAIELAKEEGGIVLAGGNKITLPPPFQDGYYIEPTVIEGLNQECRTNKEEIFGPVVTLQKFSSLDEAIQLANATGYGLDTVIWSSNTDTIHYLANNAQSGIVWVNCWLVRDLRTPFGGVKQSGLGREGGWDALRFFTESKSVTQQFL